MEGWPGPASNTSKEVASIAPTRAMRTRRTLLLVGGLLLMDLAALGPSRAPAGAQAQPSSTTARMEVEAWYQPGPPPCDPSLPVGCPPLPPAASPYPEETLHVAIANGQERARTYVAFSLAAIPVGGQVTGGTLKLPVDADPAHGSFSPEAADMAACFVGVDFEPVRGGLTTPPPTECKTRAPAVYDAGSQSFNLDLSGFAPRWTGQQRAALALFPTDTAIQAGSTWHVVFPATTPTATAPTTATLTYEPPAGAGTAPAASSGKSGGKTKSTGGSAPPAPSSGGTAPIGGGTAPSPGGTVPTGGGGEPASGTAPAPAAPTQPAVATSVFLGGFAGRGFAYPQVWALPLAILAGFAGLGRALTKDLYQRV